MFDIKSDINSKHKTSVLASFRSLQDRRVLLDDLIIIRLEGQPHLTGVPTALVRHLRLFFIDVDLLPPWTGGRVGQHLSMTAAVESNEQEGRLIDRLAAGDHAVVLQNDATAGRAQRRRDAFAFLIGQDRATVAVVDGQIIVEAQGILVQHLNGTAETRKGFPVHGVGVTRRVQIRPCLVNLTVDGKRRSVDGMLGPSGNDFAALVDQHQIRHLDHGEVHAQRINPEMFYRLLVSVVVDFGFVRRTWIDWISQRDVPCNTLIKPLFGKDPERHGQMLHLVFALVQVVGELRG